MSASYAAPESQTEEQQEQAPVTRQRSNAISGGSPRPPSHAPPPRPGAKEKTGEHEAKFEGSDEDGKVDLLQGWSPSIKFSPGQQEVKLGLPTSVSIPPPDGFPSFDSTVDIPIPGAPGFFIFVKFGVAPKVEVGKGEVAFKREVNTDPWQGKGSGDKMEISGAFGLAAEITASLDVGLKAGVPKVVALTGGGRAKVKAEAEMKVDVGGELDRTDHSPKGKLWLGMGGEGKLSGAITAFVGYEVLGFAGDLYEFEFDKLKFDFATMKLGAQFGADLGPFKPFAKGALPGDKYADFTWLFGNAVKVSKMDKAKAEALEAGGDLAAMKELKQTLGPAADMLLRSHEAAGIALEVPSGKFRVLEVEREGIDAAVEELDKLIAEQRVVERTQYDLVMYSHYASGGQSMDPVSLKALEECRKLMGSQNDRRAKFLARRAQIGPEQAAAQEAFLSRLTADGLDTQIGAASDKFVEMYRSNIQMFAGEVERIDHETALEVFRLRDQAKVQGARVEELERGQPAALLAYRAQIDAAEQTRAQRDAELQAMTKTRKHFRGGPPPTLAMAFNAGDQELAAAIVQAVNAHEAVVKMIMATPKEASPADLALEQGKLRSLNAEIAGIQTRALMQKREQRTLLLHEETWGFA